MRLTFVIVLLLFIVPATTIVAQERPDCLQPFSFVFDEFTIKDQADTKSHLVALFERLKTEDHEQARVTVYVYAGRKTKIGETESLMAQVNDLLDRNWANEKSRVQVYDGGYRAEATIELHIRPLRCSDYASNNSTYSLDEIEFEDAPSESTMVKTSDELLRALVGRTEPVCPPVGRALRICNGYVVVRVLVDEKGAVIFAKGLSGNPLLRNIGATVVRKWTFKPFKQKGKAVKVFGNITVQFTQPPDDEEGF